MWLKNVTDVTNKLDGIPYKDRRFLKIMEDQTVKIGKHFEIPLPMRNPKNN